MPANIRTGSTTAPLLFWYDAPLCGRWTDTHSLSVAGFVSICSGAFMIPNDILRRLRFALNLSNKRMIAIFKLAGHEATNEQIISHLCKEDDQGFELCPYSTLSLFLDGLIIDRRGKVEGREPVRLADNERIPNNDILRKIKIALEFKDTDIIELMDVADFKVSKGELSAIFRKKGHRNHKDCGNQFLRNFLQGLALKYHQEKVATGNNAADSKKTEQAKAASTKATSAKSTPTKKSPARKAEDFKPKSKRSSKPSEKKVYVNPALKNTSKTGPDTLTLKKTKPAAK